MCGAEICGTEICGAEICDAEICSAEICGAACFVRNILCRATYKQNKCVYFAK